MIIPAFAKINLSLRLLGTRPDGYHELSSVMQSVTLADSVRVDILKPCECAEESLIADAPELPGRIACSVKDPKGLNIPGIPKDRGNLAVRAAEAYLTRFKESGAVQSFLRSGKVLSIDITKRIPAAAGLAGGSSDAAAVLYALAEIFGSDEASAFELAAKTGSDVPFCLAAHYGRYCCLCEGRGEILTPLKGEKYTVILKTPDVEVPTKDVFRQSDRDEFVKLRKASEAEPFEGGFCFSNELQAPCISLFPEVEQQLDKLKNEGDPIICQLSGSGPTVFALYDKAEDLPGYAEELADLAAQGFIFEDIPDGLRFAAMAETLR